MNENNKTIKISLLEGDQVVQNFRHHLKQFRLPYPEESVQLPTAHDFFNALGSEQTWTVIWCVFSIGAFALGLWLGGK